MTIVLDTYHDHHNTFFFRTNALGTQYDALITNEGNADEWKRQPRLEIRPSDDFFLTCSESRLMGERSSVRGIAPFRAS